MRKISFELGLDFIGYGIAIFISLTSGLKIGGVIDWPWLVIFLPLIVAIVILLLTILGAYLYMRTLE